MYFRSTIIWLLKSVWTLGTIYSKNNIHLGSGSVSLMALFILSLCNPHCKLSSLQPLITTFLLLYNYISITPHSEKIKFMNIVSKIKLSDDDDDDS